MSITEEGALLESDTPNLKFNWLPSLDPHLHTAPYQVHAYCHANSGEPFDVIVLQGIFLRLERLGERQRRGGGGRTFIGDHSASKP